MNTILRSFFYAFGIILLWTLHSLDPDTTTLTVILHLLHSATFWTLVQVLTLVLVGLQLVMSVDFDMVYDRVKGHFSRAVVEESR